jgi:hypothetical protein
MQREINSGERRSDGRAPEARIDRGLYDAQYGPTLSAIGGEMKRTSTLGAARAVGLSGVLLAVLAIGHGSAHGFSSPVVVTSPDVDFLSEPGIDVAADGTIYVNAPDGLPLASYLYRSDDGGVSFALTGLSVRDLLPGGGDSDVALDPADGTVYLTDLYLANSTVSVSHDKGETLSFFSNPVGGLPVHDRQWLATPGSGIVYHVYNQAPSGLWVSKSIDGGMSYVFGSLAVSSVARNCNCPPGNLVAEGGTATGFSGKVGVIYATGGGGVRFARSASGGLNWSQQVISANAANVDTVSAFPAVADAGGNKLFAVWLEIVGTGQSRTTRVRGSRSTDWGVNWSAPQTLVATGTSVFPWLDARGSKVSVVLYRTTDAAKVPDSVPTTAQWFVEYLESTNAGVSFSAPAVVDSTPVKTGPICTEGIGCSGDRELGDFFQVVIESASPNRAHVTWARSLDGSGATELRYSHQ